MQFERAPQTKQQPSITPIHIPFDNRVATAKLSPHTYLCPYLNIISLELISICVHEVDGYLSRMVVCLSIVKSKSVPNMMYIDMLM